MNAKEMLEERLGIFDNLYEEMQVFGPFEQEHTFERQGQCFANAPCIKKNKCDNCVALRSLKEGKTHVKYEEHEGKIVHVTASPFVWEEKKYIAELFRTLTPQETESLGIVSEETLKYVEKLNHKLMHDKLTGVYNRMYLEEKLVIFMQKAYKQSGVSVAMCDIDFFKKVNDTYGHQAGDEVLRSFASILKEETKDKRCKVARYGGEEFLMVMPGMAKEEAVALLERIRTRYEQTPVQFEGNEIYSTASFGLVTGKYGKGSNLNSADIIRRADKNVYLAKSRGRNRVVAE